MIGTGRKVGQGKLHFRVRNHPPRSSIQKEGRTCLACVKGQAESLLCEPEQQQWHRRSNISRRDSWINTHGNAYNRAVNCIQECCEITAGCGWRDGVGWWNVGVTTVTIHIPAEVGTSILQIDESIIDTYRRMKKLSIDRFTKSIDSSIANS